MRRVVLFAPLFPPSAGVAAKRPMRFARHLRAFGWDPIVFTVEGSGGFGSDPALLDVLPAGLTVCREYAQGTLWSAWRWWEGWKARARGLGEGGRRIAPAWRRPLEDIAQLTFDLVPLDHFAVYLGSAARRGAELAREHGASAIFATGYPFSALIAAVLAGARAHLPVVLDLRDPWTLNPLFFERKPAPIRALERRLEAFCFRRAARVIVNTDAARRAYRDLYPELDRRIVALHNGFDRALFRGGEPVRYEGFTLVHFGNLFQRSMAPLLRVLATLPEDVRLVNFGAVSVADQALIAERGLGPRVSLNAAVPYADALTRLRGAGALVLVGWPPPDLAIPTKLYDYLCAERPILAITTSPEIRAILDRTGAGVVVDPADETSLRAAVLDLRARTTFAPVREAIAAFDAAAQTRVLAGHFDAVTRSAATASVPATALAPQSISEVT